MLVARAWRPLRAATTMSSHLGAIRASSTNPNAPLIDLMTNLAKPPTAGAAGYPPPNPFNAKDSKHYALKKPRYSLYCQSTRNNTITTLMSDKQAPLASFSGGSCGFKKVNRSGYEAGYQCAVRMFRRIQELAEKNTFEIDLYFKGFGQGRDAMHRALLTTEGERIRPLVATITDRTPIKIGGTRAKKMRRFEQDWMLSKSYLATLGRLFQKLLPRFSDASLAPLERHWHAGPTRSANAVTTIYIIYL
ncbi:putative ribosomal protein S11 [Lyophyllum shimeji]|uniref:Ribosomal protein S11 n=1 Tax=Lyophyllum shimeji TaxID=47721 RepID=A0A9P3PD19_LYOSH|nr:putative ribosomal protein S11 [Lyophyllum shimeji]